MTAKPKSSPNPPMQLMDYLRDARVLRVIGQIAFAVVLVGLLSLAWISILDNIEARRLTINYSFLETRASFDIADAPEWYDASNWYGEAFKVGVLNTLQIVSLGLVGATFLGILVGVLLLSSNWLVKTIARVYVEILRNTPLLVQLIFWYFVVLLGLPDGGLALPEEGIVPIFWTTLWYIPLLLGVMFIARRSAFSSRVFTGAIAAFIYIEAMRLFGGDILGDGATILHLIFLVIMASMVTFTPPEWRSYAAGAVILFLGQAIASPLFDLMFYSRLTFDPEILYAPVKTFFVFNTQGITHLQFLPTPRFAAWAAIVTAGVGVAGMFWLYAGHVTETTGRPIARGTLALLSVIGFGLVGWLLISAYLPQDITLIDDGTVERVEYIEAIEEGLLNDEQLFENSLHPLQVEHPERGLLGFRGGYRTSASFAALLIGLVIYTSGFIAEIVRAGIQAVPYGQIEAARALGLSRSQTLNNITLPQALRVIIPPMGNQYLNLAKNSSLAVAVAFSDTYQVTTTIMNQGGQSISGFTLIL
ncbi:MAG: ABC transporter permease subunit, partial [Aggregatilineales bacterium]